MCVRGFLVAALMALGGVVMADEAPRVISVTGVGEVAGVPDMATVRVGVTHENKEAAQAMAEVAEGATRVLAQLEGAGIAARDVQTGTVSLNPLWSDTRSTGGARSITGFVARMSISVRVRALEDLGGVLDAVVRDGANTLDGVQFGFAEPEPLMEEARRLAVADGRARAETLAEAAGVSLGSVRTIAEHGGGPQPMAMDMGMAREASIPIAAGELSLSVQVSMEYTIEE